MPSKKGRIKVRVLENTTENKKVYTIAVEADKELFGVADLLSKRGAIKKLSAQLRDEVKSAVWSYISGGEAFILSAQEALGEGRNEPR